mgnify:CR=1 FL=1
MLRRFRVKIGEKIFEVEVEEIKSETVTVAPATPTETGLKKPEAATPVKAAVVSGEERKIVRAPIPGTIVSVKCREGEEVRKGDPLLVLESMKMENVIYSPTSGKVKRIAVSEGSSVNYGDVLVEIE